MKHKIGFNALSRRSGQRKALKRNMVTSLFRYRADRDYKSQSARSRALAEKMITRAKNDSVHARRIVTRDITDDGIVAKLFTQIAPLFADRNGGYTRILKTGNRLGDAAEMVILELVAKTEKPKKKADDKKESKKPAKVKEDKESKEAVAKVE